jgi:hypothetical protein
MPKEKVFMNQNASKLNKTSDHRNSLSKEEISYSAPVMGFCVLITCVLCAVNSCSCVLRCLLLDTGLLARCQCSEGPGTGHLDTGFLAWFPCVFKANAEMVPKFPS